MKLDLYLFNFVNGFAKKSRYLDFFAVLFAVYLGPALFLALALIAFYTKSAELFIFPFCSALFARVAISELVYLFYKRKRPLEIMNVNQLIRKPNHPSFPSGHTAAFFALSFAVFPYNITLAIVFLIISCLVSLSRIFSGVHWPSDVLAGIIVGFLSFIVVYVIKVNLVF